MRKSLFCNDWKFCTTGNESPAVSVILPHDAMLYEKRSRSAVTGGACGYFPGGSYVYKKHFHAPTEWTDKHIILEFEGIYKNAIVNLNGKEIGHQAYGYSNFFVELDGALHIGAENEICVIADNSACPNSRWYSGSGIYRNVNLYIGEKNCILPDGLLICAEQNGVAKIKLHTQGGNSVKVTLKDGNHVCAEAIGEVIDNFAEIELCVETPKLWNEDNPNLYCCSAELFTDGTLVDTTQTAFGFRTLAWNTTGFYVNGNMTLLRGACIHHDNGILGACSFEAAELRRVRLLKEAGFNAIRMAHNPASKALLKACDLLGMYVMDEFCDNWLTHKNPYDYANEDFRAYWRQDLHAMLMKNYNHPSVVMTSIGNEISELAVPEGQKYCKEMADYCRTVDSSRPVTLGVNLMLCSMTAKGNGLYGQKKSGKENNVGSQTMDNLPTSQVFNFWMNKLGGIIDKMAAKPIADKATEEAFATLDIGGYNYATSRYEMDGKLHPNRVIVGSETLPKSLYANWQLVKKLPYLIGDFMWTGWDYLGESGIGTVRYKSFKQPGNDAPIISGGCGVIDICGKLRPEVQWNRLIWGLTEKTSICVEPLTHAGEVGSVSMWRDTDAVESWSWAGWEGKKTKVTVYSVGVKVELIVNGKSYGKRNVKENKVIFKRIAYEPGTITAISYREDGKEISRSTLVTASGETMLRLTPDKTKIAADGQDLCYVNIELVGTDGIVKSSEDIQVHVKVDGAGSLQALGSAKPNMGENFYSDTHTTYYGKALAVIRAGNETGEVSITVSAPGCDTQNLVISAS